MKHTRAIIIVSTIIAVAVCVFLLWTFWPFASSDGQTTTPPPQASSQQLETNYFTAILPNGFTITSNIEKESGLVRLKITAENKQTDTTINIMVGDIPANGINNLQEYSDRVQNQNVYTKQSFSGMPKEVTTFYSKSNGYELSAFWKHGSLYALITISSPTAESGQINILMQAFLDQWQWR